MKRTLLGLGALLTLSFPAGAQDWTTTVASKAADAAAFVQTGGKGTTQTQAGTGLLEMFETASDSAKARDAAAKAALARNTEALDSATANLVVALMNLENAKRQKSAVWEGLTNGVTLNPDLAPLDNMQTMVVWLKLNEGLERRIRAAEAAAAKAASDWKAALAAAEASGYKMDRGSLDDGDNGGDGGPGVMNTGASTSAPSSGSGGGCAPGCGPMK